MRKRFQLLFPKNYVFVPGILYTCVDCKELFTEKDIMVFQPATTKCICNNCLKYRHENNITNDKSFLGINDFVEV